jgi:hypothetical protein
MAAATIPETVTVSGQAVYDALVAMAAAGELLKRIAGVTDAPLEERLYLRKLDLFEASFGETWYLPDDSSDRADLADEIEANGFKLMLECLRLDDEPSA